LVITYEKKKKKKEGFFSAPDILLETKARSVPYIVGDQVRETPPSISNIPPKTHPIWHLSFLITPAPSLDPIFLHTHVSIRNSLLEQISKAIHPMNLY
jgi:hypothetical protein